ncbi:TBCC domain-containing protein 1-like isoform X3 [Oncorhynchus masou masou]|uniref:TBCC domain-containing protein 1-like isoform X3 n=1 Tax=Oncorhynchus masou masou TaxID=90313 RepID=UPI003183C2C7
MLTPLSDLSPSYFVLPIPPPAGPLTAMDQGGGVAVWPRMEPFLLGALQVAPPTKLSLHYLRKMAAYVRSREGCFPMLGWLMWRHIACGKLQLPEDLAWLYFETFDLLAGHPAEERLEWAENLSQCSSPRELDRQRSKLCVDTLQFLLFLYIQQLNRVSLRTSLIGEEWPSPRSRSPSSDREAKTSSQNKNWDDQAHLSFLQTHLCELLELLVEPGQLSGSGQAVKDSQVSLEALQGLSLLLEGSVSRGRNVHPIHKLLSRAPLQTQAGYSKLGRSFSLHPLLAWLRQALVPNPFGMSTCLRSGKKLAWAQQVEGAMKRAKIARNTHTAPPGSKMVLMSQVFRQTLAKDSDKLAGANVKIHRCSDAFIYLLSPLRMEGDTCEVPGGLPSLYQKAHEEREKSVQDWQKMVKDAHLNKEQRRQFQALVEQKFHEWLLESGHRQELDSLIPPCIASQDPSDSDSLEARTNDTRQEGTSIREVGQTRLPC